jgi:putative NADPH-quinone reductase
MRAPRANGKGQDGKGNRQGSHDDSRLKLKALQQCAQAGTRFGWQFDVRQLQGRLELTRSIETFPNASRSWAAALADAYAAAAREAGHELRSTSVAELDFPLLRSQHEWEHGELPAGLRQAQQDIGWSEHIVIFFPLWLGDMPALLKGFLEQVARPGFAFKYNEGRTAFTQKGLKGRSARVVVTMGMPAIVYRLYFRAHSVKSLERNILGFVGIAPVDETLIGMIGKLEPEDARKWMKKMARLGSLAE